MTRQDRGGVESVVGTPGPLTAWPLPSPLTQQLCIMLKSHASPITRLLFGQTKLYPVPLGQHWPQYLSVFLIGEQGERAQEMMFLEVRPEKSKLIHTKPTVYFRVTIY